MMKRALKTDVGKARVRGTTELLCPNTFGMQPAHEADCAQLLDSSWTCPVACWTSSWAWHLNAQALPFCRQLNSCISCTLANQKAELHFEI